MTVSEYIDCCDLGVGVFDTVLVAVLSCLRLFQKMFQTVRRFCVSFIKADHRSWSVIIGKK